MKSKMPFQPKSCIEWVQAKDFTFMGGKMQVLYKAMRKSSVSHVLAKVIASVVWACAQSMMQYLVWKGITTVQIQVEKGL